MTEAPAAEAAPAERQGRRMVRMEVPGGAVTFPADTPPEEIERILREASR